MLYIYNNVSRQAVACAGKCSCMLAMLLPMLAVLLPMFAVLLPVLGSAQTMNVGRYRMADERQLWQQTGNAAGLALDMQDTAAQRGVAYFNLSHKSGDYARVQDGNQKNSLQFFTERYQKVGKYLYGYGSFDFDMGRTKQRAWSDIMRPYNSNPFQSGSAIRGSYDHQNFTLNAKLASVRLGHFNYGAALTYQVGDLSRLRDPRSRVRLAEYRLTPSVTYTSGRHTLGAAAWYDRRKEKLTGLTTVQTDATMKYYLMTGVEYATGSSGGFSSYWREYVDHKFGGELSYGYRTEAFGSVTALTISRGEEYVYGQYKYEPGRYYTYNYGLQTHNRISDGGVLHSIDAAMGYEQAYADEFVSQLITEKDGSYTTQRWQKDMTFKKRYQMKKLDMDLHYRLSFTSEQAVSGYVGAAYTLQTVSNKHLLSTSQLEYSSSCFTVEGGHGFINNRLWIKADADYHVKGKADLLLHNSGGDYAQNVLLPDMPYYEANWWKAGVEIMWQQPLVIKRQPTQWFAKLYGSYLHTDNSLKSNAVGLSVGMMF